MGMINEDNEDHANHLLRFDATVSIHARPNRSEVELFQENTLHADDLTDQWVWVIMVVEVTMISRFFSLFEF